MKIFSLVAKLWSQIQKLWLRFPKKLKAAVHVGIEVVENLKDALASPVTDIIAMLIPGDADDKLIALLRGALPGLLVQLRLVDAGLGLKDPNAIAAEALRVLATVPDAHRYYHDLSILVAQLASDEELSWSDGVVILEYVYKKEYKAAA